MMRRRRLPIAAIAFDFDGVFTDNRVLVSQTGEEYVVCDRSDGMGIELLRSAGIQMIIISKEPNPVVSSRARKLSLEVVQGCNHKLLVLQDWLSRIDVAPENCAYLGNDINDVECMSFVGTPIAPADAHPSVLKYAAVVTRSKGGRGAIREVADDIIRVRTLKTGKYWHS
jgi:N-acylneuraminate cytidylyltransferase